MLWYDKSIIKWYKLQDQSADARKNVHILSKVLDIICELGVTRRTSKFLYGPT